MVHVEYTYCAVGTWNEPGNKLINTQPHLLRHLHKLMGKLPTPHPRANPPPRMCFDGKAKDFTADYMSHHTQLRLFCFLYAMRHATFQDRQSHLIKWHLRQFPATTHRQIGIAAGVSKDIIRCAFLSSFTEKTRKAAFEIFYMSQ